MRTKYCMDRNWKALKFVGMMTMDEIANIKESGFFVEQRGERLLEVSLECLGGGKQLAEELNVDLSAILLGYNIKGLAKELIAYGADHVYVVDYPLLEMHQSDAYANAHKWSLILS